MAPSKKTSAVKITHVFHSKVQSSSPAQSSLTAHTCLLLQDRAHRAEASAEHSEADPDIQMKERDDGLLPKEKRKTNTPHQIKSLQPFLSTLPLASFAVCTEASTSWVLGCCMLPVCTHLGLNPSW